MKIQIKFVKQLPKLFRSIFQVYSNCPESTHYAHTCRQWGRASSCLVLILCSIWEPHDAVCLLWGHITPGLPWVHSLWLKLYHLESVSAELVPPKQTSHTYGPTLSCLPLVLTLPSLQVVTTTLRHSEILCTPRSFLSIVDPGLSPDSSTWRWLRLILPLLPSSPFTWLTFFSQSSSTALISCWKQIKINMIINSWPYLRSYHHFKS